MASPYTGTCDLTADQYSQAVASQTSRLREDITADVAINSPFANIIDGGFVENNDGKTISTLVQNRVSPSYSLVAPAFTDDTLVCGTTGGKQEIGQTEYSTQLATLRGEGPLVCVKGSRLSVKNSYLSAEASLKNSITQLINNDIRYQMLSLSGVKFVANSTKSFGNLLTGGRQQVSASWSGDLPDSPMSFKALIRLGQFMNNDLRVPHFGNGAGRYYTVIAGDQQMEYFRNESQLKDVLLNQVSGGYMEGMDAFKSYLFTDATHRGLKFAIDQEPLRFNEVDGSGNPIFLEPGTSVASDHGKDYIPNPEYVNALYEVGFLVARDSFKRLAPRPYTGEGSWKFSPQMSGGELEWYYNRGDACNKFGDFGNHLFQVTRAYQPITPHAVIPFAYARCDDDLGLAPCSTSQSGLTL